MTNTNNLQAVFQQMPADKGLQQIADKVINKQRHWLHMLHLSYMATRFTSTATSI
jgi:hypothetical protein